ncbi:MAG: isopeptide-forming domain-containing fimbrial protein [Gammaproteobacteria bacterium]|nr:isopeptide-forming domain-containing fimbrial protein [Gammaproteobacteria bacterium]
MTLGEGGSVELDLTPALTDAITLTSTTTIPVDVILQRAGTGAFNRDVTVSLGYGPNAGSITPISSQALTLGLDNTIGIESFALPVGSTTSIPAGSILQLTITNASSGFGNQSINVFTENGGDRSRIELEMTPKLNIDSLGFYDDTLANGGGSALTNAEPGDTIYARAIISDPFGEDDIESVDDEPDIALTPPSGGGGNATVTFVSPEYDDGDPGMRSFEWSLALPPEGTGGTERPRGTWSVQVTANEGSEETIGGPTFVSQTVAEGFTTLDDPNLSTSTKTFPAAGDVDPGDTLTYTITLNNTGGMDADNVSFSDTLQSSPVALTYASGSTTCTDEMGNPLPNPSATGSTVTLNNISVNGNDSCTITINVTVGSGSPGDTIDNTATITNPMGPGATATATTILLSESQIPEPGNKQLYLDGLGGSSILTRTQPGTTSATTLDVDESATLTFPAPGTLLGTSLSAGPVTVNLDLEAQGGAGFLGDDRHRHRRAVRGPERRRRLSVDRLANPDPRGAGGNHRDVQPDREFAHAECRRTLPPRHHERHDQLRWPAGHRQPGSIGAILRSHRTLLQPIEITDVTFWDVSGDDAGGCTPNCGSQIDPPFVMTGDTIWVRATVSDIFGSNDINTGCDTLTSTTNCPTLTLTDPNGGDQTPGSNAMSFLQDPSSTSRQFEFEITPDRSATVSRAPGRSRSKRARAWKTFSPTFVRPDSIASVHPT